MEKESFFSSSEHLLPALETNRESSYLMLNWDQSMNHNSHFGSAMSSGVGEFLGEISSHSHPYINEVNTTANQSCQTDHLRSPPKLNLSIMDRNHFAQSSHLGEFKDRDANFSCPGGRNYSGMPQCGVSCIDVADVPIQNRSQFEMELGIKFATVDGQFTGAREEPPKSDITVAYGISTRKRKPYQKGRTKDEPNSPVAENLTSVLDEKNVNIKRLKSLENVDTGRDNIKTKVKQASSNNSVDGSSKTKEKNAEPSEPPKLDYIHVRARRGQATDSHSLAERVRREKISERMKFLQSLVPGCDKVTGKAVVLDEIINYVQSLQCQVEFLSMKLAAVNPGTDFSMENVFRKDMNQSHSSLARPVFSMDTSTPIFSSSPQPPPNASLRSMMINGLQNHFPVNSSDSTMSRSLSIQMPAINGSGDSVAQGGNFWNSEHQNVGHMGFQQIHESMFCPQQLPGEALPSSHTKIEL